MSGGKGDKTVTSSAEIPGFLKPFLQDAAGTGAGALDQLEGLITPGTSLVAGFNPLQQQGQQQAIDVAGGAGGFIPTAQDTLLSTARGDFLAGGPGFDEAVQASIRAAQPNILSAFGSAGRGVSGLGQAAIQRAASDAFAGLYSQERSNQLNAASALPDIGLAGSNILSQIGATQQAQAQNELEGPVAAQERLLSNSLGVTPSQASLFGQTQVQPSSGSKLGGALGGGLALAGLPVTGGGSLAGNYLGGGKSGS